MCIICLLQLKSLSIGKEWQQMQNWQTFTKEPRIAYFTMEIGITNDIPTYSGGLGVLAGDTIKSAADDRCDPGQS